MPAMQTPGFNPWVRKIPWRREWLPTPVFFPGKFHGHSSLTGYSPWGHRVQLDWATNILILTKWNLWAKSIHTEKISCLPMWSTLEPDPLSLKYVFIGSKKSQKRGWACVKSCLYSVFHSQINEDIFKIRVSNTGCLNLASDHELFWYPDLW